MKWWQTLLSLIQKTKLSIIPYISSTSKAVNRLVSLLEWYFKKPLKMKSASNQMLLHKFHDCYLVIDLTITSHEWFMDVYYRIFVYILKSSMNQRVVS